MARPLLALGLTGPLPASSRLMLWFLVKFGMRLFPCLGIGLLLPRLTKEQRYRRRAYWTLLICKGSSSSTHNQRLGSAWNVGCMAA